jgi:hypothetical protein
MAQTQILAAGTTAATSTDVVLTAGSHANVSIFSAGVIPGNAKLYLNIDTNGADALVVEMGAALQSYHLIGPGTFRLFRPAQTASIGASSET